MSIVITLYNKDEIAVIITLLKIKLGEINQNFASGHILHERYKQQLKTEKAVCEGILDTIAVQRRSLGADDNNKEE